MKKFVIGDIHGNYKALKQCLERSGFDYENDQLISLGDIVDGYYETFECVEELLKIKNLIVIKGNHDDVFHYWMIKGVHMWQWLQGGEGTLKSYVKHSERPISIQPYNGAYVTNLTVLDIPETHRNFYKNMVYYHIDSENRVFVHGGFDRNFKIEDNSIDTLMWDRTLFQKALSHTNKDHKFKVEGDYSEIYIGHTTTQNWGTVEPLVAANFIYNLDTGAGWTGKLTIMNIETKEFFQSDLATDLYPGIRSR